MSPSYGYTYLTSYGWSGSGTGLRKGALVKPLAVPPKKNLSGLGKDRDEAFPFWDHLFTAASKAITIRVSSDDEDADETEVSLVPPTCLQDPSSSTDPLRRTTTGILSNRRPISGTPASTSGSATPNPSESTADGRPSLLAIAKREAAKRGLYARFFRGPVLGPDDDLHVSHLATPPSPSSLGSDAECDTKTVPAPAHECVVDEAIKSNKRKSTEGGETKEERRERKRLKKERKAARAAERASKALAREKTKNDRRDEKARFKNEASSRPKKTRKRSRSTSGLEGNDAGPEKCTRDQTVEVFVPTNQVRRASCEPLDATEVPNAAVLTTRKKKGKRKDTH